MQRHMKIAEFWYGKARSAAQRHDWRAASKYNRRARYHYDRWASLSAVEG